MIDTKHERDFAIMLEREDQAISNNYHLGVVDRLCNEIERLDEQEPPDVPVTVDLDMAGDPNEVKPHLAMVGGLSTEKTKVEGFINLPDRKTVDVGEEVVGFVVTLAPSLQDRDVTINVKSVKEAFAREFPGKSLVILNGLEVQPIYTNDESFEKVVEAVVKKYVDSMNLLMRWKNP